METCKVELLNLLKVARKTLDKGDVREYYLQCSKILRLCQFMVTTEPERDMRSMAKIAEVTGLVRDFNYPDTEALSRAFKIIENM